MGEPSKSECIPCACQSIYLAESASGLKAREGIKHEGHKQARAKHQKRKKENKHKGRAKSSVRYGNTESKLC
eukprot:scaffold23280_cov21-Tisochrysis_lutea.AAC.2